MASSDTLDKVKNFFGSFFGPSPAQQKFKAPPSENPNTFANQRLGQDAIRLGFGQTQIRNPWSVEEIQRRIDEVKTPEMRDMQTLLPVMKETMGNYMYPKNVKPEYIVPIASAISDFFTGSDYLKNYKTPEQKAKEKALNNLAAQTEYAKALKMIADPSVDMLKNQLLATTGTETTGYKSAKGAGLGNGNDWEVTGYVRNPQFKVGAGEVNTIRSAVADKDAINNILSNVTDVIKNSDPVDLANPFSSAKADLERYFEQAKSLYRGEAFARLGVPSHNDEAILAKSLGDIGLLTAAGKGGGLQAVINRIENLKNSLSYNVDQKLKVRGYVPAQKQFYGNEQSTPTGTSTTLAPQKPKTLNKFPSLKTK